VRYEKLRRVVRRGERDRTVALVQVSAVNSRVTDASSRKSTDASGWVFVHLPIETNF
jgi:hypothetical protein